MIQQAIKQLWRAKTRSEASEAIDRVHNALYSQLDALSADEFESVISVIRIKGRDLVN